MISMTEKFRQELQGIARVLSTPILPSQIDFITLEMDKPPLPDNYIVWNFARANKTRVLSGDRIDSVSYSVTLYCKDKVVLRDLQVDITNGFSRIVASNGAYKIPYDLEWLVPAYVAETQYYSWPVLVTRG